ncbi:MAG: hypothetical protein D6780_01940, partial [Candidatus Dadabacteria bacterium]
MAKNRKFSNTEKAALILMSLGKDIASMVIQNLTEAEVKRISRAFMTVSEVSREEQFEVSREFHNMLKASEKLLVDGKEFAKEVIAEAFGKGEEGGELIDYIVGSKKEPISQIIQDVPEKILHAFVLSEHPQTIAFLLTRMNPDQSAAILQAMDEETQTDI